MLKIVACNIVYLVANIYLFHKHLKPTHEHPTSKNPNLLLPQFHNAKTSTPTRTLPRRAMTFLRWSEKSRSTEPSWCQEGTNVLLHHQSCHHYCYCRQQTFDNMNTIWHDSFYFIPNNFRNWSNVKLWALACVWFGYHCTHEYNHNNGSWIHYVLLQQVN